MNAWQKQKTRKTIVGIVIFTFLLQGISWAQTGANIWGQARPGINLKGATNLNGIRIPYDAGRAQEAFLSSGKELIINIQDAHASFSAQQSIVSILDNLAANYDLDLIALEGAEGPVDVSILRTFPDPEIRKETKRAVIFSTL